MLYCDDWLNVINSIWDYGYAGVSQMKKDIKQ